MAKIDQSAIWEDDEIKTRAIELFTQKVVCNCKRNIWEDVRYYWQTWMKTWMIPTRYTKAILFFVIAVIDKAM